MNPMIWNSNDGVFSAPMPDRFVSGKKILRLTLRSRRKTWLEFHVLLTDDTKDNGYRARILTEWDGVETIDLRVSSLERFGRPVGLEACTRLCFAPRSCAFAPTILELQGFEWLDEVPLYRVNDRDWMLENFMSPRYWDTSEWRRVTGDGLAPGEVEFTKNWIWCVMSYTVRPGRCHALAYEKKYDLDIRDFDGMLLSVTTDRRAVFKCRLQVDGRTYLALERRGTSDREDLRIPLNGSRLQNIAIEVAEAGPHSAAEEGQKIGINLAWIQLQKKGYDPAANMEVRGCDRILPPTEAQPFTNSLPLSFLIDHRDIAEIRAKAKSSPFHQKLYQGVINEAESHLRYPDPETLVGRFSFVPYAHYGLKLMQDPEVHAHQVLVYSAFAYALSGETRYADTARRYLLSLCRCDHWSTGFITRFPVGVEGYRHPLADGPMARSVALCYDLIFNRLTESDKREVEDAMMRCAVPVLDSFLQRVNDDPAFKRSNMFMCYSLCLLYAIKVAERTHPEAREFHPRCLARLQEALTLIYEPDGSSHEGIVYWAFTTSLAVEAVLLLSKEFDKPVPDLMPAGFQHTIDFILHLHSTRVGQPQFLGFADGAFRSDEAGLSILFFYKLLGRKDALWLFNQVFLPDILEKGDRLEVAESRHDAPPPHFLGAQNWMVISHGLLLMKFYDDSPAEKPALPAYRRFENCGRIFMRSGVDTGDTLLFFEGGPQTFFHTHRDKGQFLLDAKGVQFITDAGMISYHDPGSMYYGSTAYHNVMSLRDADQAYGDPSRAVQLLKEESNERFSFIRADLTQSYHGKASYRRNILFLRPDYFLVLDEVEAPGGGMRWNFHSTVPFHPSAHQATLDANEAALILCWPPGIIADVKISAYHDEKGRVTCHNLSLRAAETLTHAFMPMILLPFDKADREAAVCAEPMPGTAGLTFTVHGSFGRDVIKCAVSRIEVRRGSEETFTVALE